MGYFLEGKWQEGFYKPDADGRFIRTPTVYHEPLEQETLYQQRYLLYVSLACPWAHRSLIARSILGLSDYIDVAVVDWLMSDDSWAFNPARSGCTVEPVFGHYFLKEVYLESDKHYTGRVTVPACWDKKLKRFINNESREILRHLARLAPQKYDLQPNPAIDEIIDDIYTLINNGVYRAGFATTQNAYDEAVQTLFQALDRWESVLDTQPFVAGQAFSEADICFFTTLVRFDPVYFIHFKCSKRRIVDYPNLWSYLRSIYQMKGIAETCNFEHIRHHYYESHRHINPYAIVACSPESALDSKHDRWQRFPQAVFPTA